MKIVKTKIHGLKFIKSQIFKDKRGFLKETYRKNILDNNINFPFDIMSFSKKNVLRGLHMQTNKRSQAKIITVTNGTIFDVAVDLRKNSKTFGKYVGIKISHNDDYSFYIPSGFAHGFLCLSKTCTVNYKCSEYRDAKSEVTIDWKDKDLNIKWPISNPILSKKDKHGTSLINFIR
jgi:dTDP-4-dehydrorhamnose 3,5-epimerase